MPAASSSRVSEAALSTLIVLQVVMLAALFTRTPPHPPLEVLPFAIAPFLSVAISTAVAALVLGPTATASGRIMSLAAGVLGFLSYGPQKWIDPSISRIWPAVLCAQMACAALAYAVLSSRSNSTRAAL